MRSKNLQEELAIERTRLAEERTHLSYIRTGLSLLLGGLFFTGYFHDNTVYLSIGAAGAAIGVLFFAYGFYAHRKHALRKILGFKRR